MRAYAHADIDEPLEEGQRSERDVARRDRFLTEQHRRRPDLEQRSVIHQHGKEHGRRRNGEQGGNGREKEGQQPAVEAETAERAWIGGRTRAGLTV